MVVNSNRERCSIDDKHGPRRLNALAPRLVHLCELPPALERVVLSIEAPSD